MVSIVNNPGQFASVTVPVELIVPPSAPDSVAIVRDSLGILLSWLSPDSGIDNAPLKHLEGYELWRNGVLYAELDSAATGFRDSSVVSKGWYEYRLRGFVSDREGRLEGQLSEPAGGYAGADPTTVAFQRDDDSREAFYIVGYSGEDNRFGARFDLTGLGDSARVYWIDLYMGSSDPCEVAVAGDNNGQPLQFVRKSYRTTPVANGWHRFRFPADEQPLFASSDGTPPVCWVVVYYLAATPDAPPIGVDVSTKDERYNCYYAKESGWKSFGEGQLMLRVGAVAIGDSVPPEEPLPTEFAVGQNYPNPFNGTTLLPIDLPERQQISINLYDTDGRLVSRLFDGVMEAGRSKVALEVAELPTGVYFLRITSSETSRMVKVVLIK